MKEIAVTVAKDEYRRIVQLRKGASCSDIFVLPPYDVLKKRHKLSDANRSKDLLLEALKSMANGENQSRRLHIEPACQADEDCNNAWNFGGDRIRFAPWCKKLEAKLMLRYFIVQSIP